MGNFKGLNIKVLTEQDLFSIPPKTRQAILPKMAQPEVVLSKDEKPVPTVAEVMREFVESKLKSTEAPVVEEIVPEVVESKSEETSVESEDTSESKSDDKGQNKFFPSKKKPPKHK